jgi:hypothetical protein
MPTVEFRPVSRTVVGTPAEVHNVLVNATTRGRLVSASSVQRVGRDTVRVELVLMEPASIARPVARPAVRSVRRRSVSRRYKMAAGAVVAALGVLIAVGVLLAVLVHWMMAHLALILGSALILAALALGLAGRASRSGAGHCPGAWHR